jgi:hypothetical protein
MKLKVEQLDSSVKGRVIRKTYKRRNAKLNRRLAKADLENAPTKPRYRGYVSCAGAPSGALRTFRGFPLSNSSQQFHRMQLYRRNDERVQRGHLEGDR